MKLDNYFHIHTPYYGAWVKYGWQKNDWGIGLAKDKVDKLAKADQVVVVRYGKEKQQYTISAKKIQQYPKERIKNYDLWVYIVPKSALNYRKESMEDLGKLGIFG